MLCRTLNLGILAHVDAGKTTLTERLLYAAGVVAEVGSVDDGTTQTDYLAVERQRGITIRSAVVSFTVDDVAVNLIDTPGHPDFIAEVERVLCVLDGAVLVLSAVEGVQPQTRILMRALQRLRIPTLLFLNKIDRPGAADEHVVRAVADRLTPAVVPMGAPHALGTRAASFAPFGGDDPDFRSRLAEVLAERDDGILASYLEDEAGVPYGRLREELASQTRRVLVHPLFFGSALTGAGVDALTAGIAELLPASAGVPEGPVSATVFKVERDPGGEKLAYARVFSGTVRTRDRLAFGAGLEGKVTAIAVSERGRFVQRPSVSAGGVAKLSGLDDIRVGDRLGEPGTDGTPQQFPPPTLESVVAARTSGDRARLFVALGELAEQDPLIDVRRNGAQEVSVSLYGEVQKEVLEATLLGEYGIAAEFREATPIYVERPTGRGEAVEVLHAPTNPFFATIGLRVEPAPADSGVDFRLAVDARSTPLYVYKTLDRFTEAMAGYVRETLQEGVLGWEVTDCRVTMTRCAYSVPDGPPSRRGPLSTAADFRKLTPLVLMQALERAGTVACEPMLRVSLEIPSDALGGVLSVLGRMGAAVETPSLHGNVCTLETALPAARARDLQRQLPGLTSGEAVLESRFEGYEAANGAQPTRRRTRPNPLNREEYLLHLARRMGA